MCRRRSSAITPIAAIASTRRSRRGCPALGSRRGSCSPRCDPPRVGDWPRGRTPRGGGRRRAASTDQVSMVIVRPTAEASTAWRARLAPQVRGAVTVGGEDRDHQDHGQRLDQYSVIARSGAPNSTRLAPHRSPRRRVPARPATASVQALRRTRRPVPARRPLPR